MNVLHPSTYRPAKCAQCGTRLPGFAKRDGLPQYCGSKCARKGQPNKVIIGAGKGSSAG